MLIYFDLMQVKDVTVSLRHRNFIADFGITTPKQMARSLVKFGTKHPELKMSTFVILQVRGDLPPVILWMVWMNLWLKAKSTCCLWRC